MDAVSHLVEDSQLRDEPVSGETDDPLDWRSASHLSSGAKYIVIDGCRTEVLLVDWMELSFWVLYTFVSRNVDMSRMLGIMLPGSDEYVSGTWSTSTLTTSRRQGSS